MLAAGVAALSLGSGASGPALPREADAESHKLEQPPPQQRPGQRAVSAAALVCDSDNPQAVTPLHLAAAAGGESAAAAVQALVAAAPEAVAAADASGNTPLHVAAYR